MHQRPASGRRSQQYRICGQPRFLAESRACYRCGSTPRRGGLRWEDSLVSLSASRSREQSSSSTNETCRSASANKNCVRSNLNLAILVARSARSASATAFADRPNSPCRSQRIRPMSRNPSGDTYCTLPGHSGTCRGQKACPDTAFRFRRLRAGLPYRSHRVLRLSPFIVMKAVLTGQPCWL